MNTIMTTNMNNRRGITTIITIKKRIHMKLSLLFILTIQITMMQMMMIMHVNGLSVGVPSSPLSTISLNNDENGRHQSMDRQHHEQPLEQQKQQQQHSIEIMRLNEGSGTVLSGNNAKRIESTADRINNDNIHMDAIKKDNTVQQKAITMMTSNSISKNEFSSLDTTTTNSIFSLKHNEKEEIFECGSPENLHKGSFTGYDYAIVLGMLIISLGIGAFYGFCRKSGSGSSNEFLLGSEMAILPVTLSLTTSFITAIELLGNPSEMFYQGTQFSLIVIPMVLVIPVAVKMFYPIYYKLELTSCYEYLGIRFGKDLRIMGALLYIVQMSFYTAVAVLAPAIALSKATGLNTRLAVALIYLVCIFYSSQGGMKAVVIADTFQACVLAVSLVLIVVLGVFYTGGFYDVFQKASEHNRLEFLNFDPNPTTRHTVFSVVIGGFFYWASLFCTNQASVQKCMSLKSLKLAKLALGFAILGLIVVFLINFYTGLMVFTHYADCDPLSSGQIGATDQLLPFYIMDVYKNIYSIAGIFVAGIFAASLGTVASALNSLSAVTCEDILINGFNIKLRPEKGAMYAKWMSLGYGVFSFILVFVVERLGGVLQATLTLNGLVGGVTLGLFVLGIVFKRANAKGAFYGGLIALVLVIYIGVMAQITNVDPKPLSKSMEKCNCFVSNTNTTTLHPTGLDLKEKGILTTTTEIPLQTIELSTTQDMLMMLKDKIMNDSNVELENNNDENNDSRRSTSMSNNNGNSVAFGSSSSSDHHHHSHQNQIDDRLGRINDDSTLNRDNDQGFRFSSIYRVSYMWYSMIGTLLTIIFGLIISIIYDVIAKHRILKITQHQQQQENINCNVNMNGSSINCVEKQLEISKINENLKSHHQYGVPETLQMKYSEKIGIDNFALKIDDEK